MIAYSFFDVETPNRRNDRICSIGIERTDAYGRIEYSEHFFVDPEQGFDAMNMEVHHISPSQVKNKPNFAELWQRELADVISGSIMVAHNAPFDMSVLGKALDCYELGKPALSVIDTCSLAQQHLSLSDYRLPTVCDHYGVELLQHHNAMADTQACEGVYWAMADEFDFKNYSGTPYVWVPYDPRSKKASCCDQIMTDLYGIALGLVADKVILPEEIVGLREWMSRNERFRKTQFVCNAFEMLEQVMDDGVVTYEEHARILSLTRPFAQNGHNKVETRAMQELIGYLRGVMCDKKINVREVTALRAWMDDSQAFEDENFKKVHETVSRVIADGVVDADEEAELLSLFGKIIDPMESGSRDVGNVQFTGRRFVLSGDFSHGTKSAVETYIKEHGGEVAGTVSGKVAYVVVGSEGSVAYAMGTYGSKVKKAMSLQDAGKPIQIIQEDQLFA